MLLWSSKSREQKKLAPSFPSAKVTLENALSWFVRQPTLITLLASYYPQTDTRGQNL